METNATDEVAIREMLATYKAALNDGRSADVLPLDAANGVFMVPCAASNVGNEAILPAYDPVFPQLTFDVVSEGAELVQLAPDRAPRPHQLGRLHHPCLNGQKTTEANQELIVWKMDGGARRRIARHSVSPRNPPGLDRSSQRAWSC